MGRGHSTPRVGVVLRNPPKRTRFTRTLPAHGSMTRTAEPSIASPSIRREPLRAVSAATASHTTALTNIGRLTRPASPAITPAATARRRSARDTAKTQAQAAAPRRTRPSSRGNAGGNNSYTEFGDATTRSAPYRYSLGLTMNEAEPDPSHPKPPISPVAAAPNQPARRSRRRARHAPARGIERSVTTCSAS